VEQETEIGKTHYLQTCKYDIRITSPAAKNIKL